MRTFFTNSIGETAMVRWRGTRANPGEAQPAMVRRAMDKLKVSHIKLQARFDTFERWLLLDDNLDWHDVVVEYDDAGFMACETGRTAIVAGLEVRPEDVVQHVILSQPGFDERETRVLGRQAMVIE